MAEFVTPLLAATVLVLSAVAMVLPPPMVALRAWLHRDGIDVDDAALVGAQVGLLKACLFSVLALVVAGLVGVALSGILPIGSGWAFGPALALLMTAVVSTSAVSFPGSSTRRASLTPRNVTDLATRGTLATAGALGAGVPVLALACAAAYRSQTRPVMTYPRLSAGPFLPAQDLSLFAQVVAVSALLSVVGLLALRYTLRRPAFSQAGGEVDLALRRLFSRRITAGVIGGQLVLLGVTLPGVQMFSLHDVHTEAGQLFYTVSDPWLLVGALGGILVLAAGVIVWVCRSGIFLLWSPSLRRTAVAQRTEASRPDASSPVT